jgi:hypothetical protein
MALDANAFEERLARFLYERSEEARAVRVGEKETSDQAAIVARYADLFTREQLDQFGDPEDERAYRLREACLGGIVVGELAERSDQLENAILAERVEFQGEELPLRSAQAMLALLDDYDAREELGKLSGMRRPTSTTSASSSCAPRRRSMRSSRGTRIPSSAARTESRSTCTRFRLR